MKTNINILVVIIVGVVCGLVASFLILATVLTAMLYLLGRLGISL